MPAASSYIRNNDYKTLDFRPYRLPVNDIAKTLMAKSTYWMQGAEKVKSRYDDALGLDLTNKENQRIKKDYMSKSEEMIKAMSSENLGNPDVQQAGVGIFKNLFSDRGIMFDDQYTKHLEGVRTTYQGLLKTDPAKASTINLGYAMEDAQKFANDPDRTSSEMYYNRRRDYTPFYDPTSDIDSAMKHCKPSHNEQQSPAYGPSKGLTGYMTSTSDKSLSKAHVTECFQAGLSEQAKQQLNINGYMAFRNNKQGLAIAYNKHLGDSVDSLIHDRGQLSTQIADLTKKQRFGTITQEEKGLLNSYNETYKVYGNELSNLNDTRKLLESGNMTPIDKDYENIAGLIYTNMKTSQFGSAFSYDDFTKKMIADPVQMQAINHEFEARQQEDKQNHEMAMGAKGFEYNYALKELEGRQALELQAAKDGKKKTASDGSDLTPIASEDQKVEPTEHSFSDFQRDVHTVEGSISDNNEEIRNNLMTDPEFMQYVNDHPIKSATGQVVKLTDLSANYMVESPIFQEYLKVASKNNKMYPELNSWRDKDLQLKIRQGTLNEITKKLESQIDPSLKDNKHLLSNIKDVVNYNGTTITASDINDDHEGKVSKVKMVFKNLLTGQVDNSGSDNVAPEFSINGKIVRDDATHIKLLKLYEKVTDATKANVSKLNDRRKELYGNQNYKLAHYFDVDLNGENVKRLQEKFKSIPKASGDGDITINGFDPATGDVKVVVPFMKGGKNDAQTLKERTNAATVDAYGAEGSGQYILRGLAGFNKSAEYGLSPDAMTNAVYLKSANDAALKDGSIKVGQIATTLPIPVKRGVETLNWRVESIKTSNNGVPSIKYKLVDEKGVPRGYGSDPFTIMKTVSDLNR